MLTKIRSVFLWSLLFVAVVNGLDYYRTRAIAAEIAVDQNLVNLEGDAVDLLARSQAGPLLVYFWATWCGPCKAVTPTVEWLAKTNNVVSVALGSGSNETLKAYLKSTENPLEVINDNSTALSSSLNVNATPTVLIVHNGKIVSATMGISSPMGLWFRLKSRGWFNSKP